MRPLGDDVAPPPPPLMGVGNVFAGQSSHSGSWSLPPDAQVPSLGDLAARALAAGAAMAREYATAAGELCKSADTSPSARASARRLLRLAMAHLET